VNKILCWFWQFVRLFVKNEHPPVFLQHAVDARMAEMIQEAIEKRRQLQPGA
jgi:hypothetical protein